MQGNKDMIDRNQWMAVLAGIGVIMWTHGVPELVKAEEWTLEQKVAQMFFVTPDQLTGVNGTTVAGEVTREAFVACPVGGIILMEDNLQSEEQVQQLTEGYQQLSEEETGIPMWIGIDEEGGRVARIANSDIMEVPVIPSMHAIGETGDPQQAYEAGTEIGSYLKTLGFNVDFAPVADLWTNPENQVIGDRSFGTDPELVSDMVSLQIRGFHEMGIQTAVKHFPGHGDTEEDSHSGYAYSYGTEESMRNLEWKPFQAGIAEGTEFVMLGHICCPNITDSDLPASLSEKMVTEILRNELGFDGVVITDAMNMGAIAGRFSAGEAAVRAIEAGADVILMPENLQEAYTAVLQAVKDGRISEKRIDASAERVKRTKMG